MTSKTTNTKKKTTKKKVVNTKIHIKNSVKELAIFIAILLIVGLIFMNPLFTALLVFGILLILWLSSILEKKKKSKVFRIVINSVVIIGLLGAIAGVCGVAWFLKYIVDNSPEFNEEVLSMTQTTKIYDSAGVQIAELGTQKREIITYDQLNEALVDALIATEDSRFFQHNGFDAPRFFLASLKQGLGNSNAGGASTLTMQVVKNTFNKENSKVTKGFEGIARKFTDIYMAVFKIEKNYSKQEIIELYLNNHFLGNNAYGIEQAARTYFNKNAKDLNISESALLIGLYQAPSAYDPFKNPEAAYERRRTVLGLMLRHGYISQEEYDIANDVPVTSLLSPQTNEQKYWSYLNTVVDEANKKYGVNPHTTSVEIYTNMNSYYQQVVDDILSGKTYKWENPEVQAGFAVIDVQTGKITAIGAGRNQNGNRLFNYATGTKRQLGSTAKPIFDYGPGIEYNNWSTYQLFDDSRYFYSTGQEIRNSDRGYMGVITLRTALAQSRNIPALKAFQQVDNQKILQFAQSLGITLEKESVNSNHLHEAYSIGSFNGSNPLELAGAYAAFANGGYYNEPYTISKIKFRDTGVVITHDDSERKQVMSSATAFMITDVLKTAVNNGLSGVAQINGVNVAGKTGTTNYTAEILYKHHLPSSAGVNDAWVVGYDPETVISVWYGYEPINDKYFTTATTAYTQRKGLFGALGSKIFKKNGKDFAVPNTVVKVPVEISKDVNQQPKLPSEFTPSDKIVYEYFKKGTEPTEVSNAYRRLNDVTGFKADYDPETNTVTLTWNKSAPDVEDLSASYGDYGYRLYKGSDYLGYTKDTKMVLTNVNNPNGTYRVAAAYANTNMVDSLGVTATIEYTDTSDYEIHWQVPTNKEYQLNASLEPYDASPSSDDVKLTRNGEYVTPSVKVSSIKDKNDNNIANISTSSANEYKITYVVSYKSYSTTITRKVKVIDNSSNNEPNTNGQ